MGATTTPLLSEENGDEAAEAREQTTPDVEESGHEDEGQGEDVPESGEEEEDGDILAGLILWGTAWRPHYKYPGFQVGYRPARRGNPLPGAVARYVDTQGTTTTTTGNANGRGSTVSIDLLWNDLLEELEPEIARPKRTKCILQGLSLFLFVMASIIAAGPLLQSHHARLWHVWMLLLVIALVVCLLFLEIYYNRIHFNVIVDNHNALFKENARIQLKLKVQYLPLIQSIPIYCFCLRSSETHLILRKYVPVSERQAEIAFV